MEEKTVFVDGLRVFEKSENAPDFVICNLSLNMQQFIDGFPKLEQYRNDRGYINIGVLRSKNGRLYLKVNTYKKDKRDQNDHPAPQNENWGQQEEAPF